MVLVCDVKPLYLSSLPPLSLLFLSFLSCSEFKWGRGGQLRQRWVKRLTSNELSLEDVSLKCIFLPAVFSFPSLVNEESLIGVSKPLPKQLWEAKKVRGYMFVRSCLFCVFVARSLHMEADPALTITSLKNMVGSLVSQVFKLAQTSNALYNMIKVNKSSIVQLVPLFQVQSLASRPKSCEVPGIK